MAVRQFNLGKIPATASCYQRCCGSSSSSSSGSSACVPTVEIEDNFDSFDTTTNWEANNGAVGQVHIGRVVDPGAGATSVLGLPSTTAGGGAVRLTSILNDREQTGFASQASYTATQGRLTLDFETGADSGAGLGAVNDTNVDVLLGLALVNTSTGNFVGIYIAGLNYSADREVYIHNSGGSVRSGGPGDDTDWSYSTAYTYEICSDGTDTTCSLLNAGGGVVFSNTFAGFSFADLGTYKIVIYQEMGIPGGEYYTDASVDYIIFETGCDLC